MLEDLTNSLNNLFKNDMFRTFAYLITGVWLGYTLQPVPEWLNKIFDTSNIVKFLIIFIVGILSFYPLDTTEVRNILVGTIATMIVFEYFRTVSSNVTLLQSPVL
jgi:hypothetical protein